MELFRMGRRLLNVIDMLLVTICLPFYAVALPAVMLLEWLRQKRKVRLGLEVTHWPAKDVREDYLVVDVSRCDEGLVGIRRRRWGVLGNKHPPPYREATEYIEVSRFWVPHPLRLRARPT